jgi:hypothetical protein
MALVLHLCRRRCNRSGVPAYVAGIFGAPSVEGRARRVARSPSCAVQALRAPRDPPEYSPLELQQVGDLVAVPVSRIPFRQSIRCVGRIGWDDRGRRQFSVFDRCAVLLITASSRIAMYMPWLKQTRRSCVKRKQGFIGGFSQPGVARAVSGTSRDMAALFRRFHGWHSIQRSDGGFSTEATEATHSPLQPEF